MTKQVIEVIHERTDDGTYEIHLWDNGSNNTTVETLFHMYGTKLFTSLHLDSRNTGCCYPKGVFQAMADSEYYVVTDNDVLCPKLSPDWLSRMLAIMNEKPKIGLLTLRLPPEWLQMPISEDDNVIYCKAVGNTFKMVRRAAWPDKWSSTAMFGDDSTLSTLMAEKGWQIAFCKDLWCLHLGQCDNWGYTDDQVKMDPRKAGYGTPYVYKYEPDTYRPL